MSEEQHRFEFSVVFSTYQALGPLDWQDTKALLDSVQEVLGLDAMVVISASLIPQKENDPLARDAGHPLF